MASVKIAIEHGPASFSAKHPRITHKFLSHGVETVSDFIISATSITVSLDGNGESSRRSVITYIESMIKNHCKIAFEILAIRNLQKVP